MPKHTVYQGRLSRFVAESKFEKTNCTVFAEEAVSESFKLRQKIAEHRILPDLRQDHQERELRNAFRL